MTNQDGQTPIRAVFFDIGGVLLKFDLPEIARKIAWAVRRHPIKIARFLWSSELGEKVERGILQPKKLFEMFRAELDYTGSYREFSALWCDHFTLNRESNALLKQVAKHRPVYLLSNTNHLHYEFIRKNFPFPKHIKGAVLSHKLKLRKPEAAIYEAALKRARVAPREALFIDDLLINVEGARKVGMRALHFKNAVELGRELKTLGLLRSSAAK